MGLQITQECDLCKIARRIDDFLSEEDMGWKVVELGNGKKTLCWDCQLLVLTFIRKGVGDAEVESHQARKG